MSAPLSPAQLEAITRLDREQRLELIELLEERQRREAQRLFYRLYPEEDTPWTGPSIMGGLMQPGQVIYARHKYPRHMEFLAAGAEYRERCMMAANRIGKTFSVGGFETACHLTGLYPDWWEGKRFEQPISAWAAGDTYETTRDILQLTLLGEVGWEGARKVMDGRGIIPGELLGGCTWRSGVQNLVDTIEIRHVTGGVSKLALKSYDQGRKAFQGTGRHVCIAEGELVQMADGTLRAIEDVCPGDQVLTVTIRGEVAARRVAGVHDNGERECVTLAPQHGAPMILTPDHEVFSGYTLQNKARADSVDKVAQPRPGTFWPTPSVDLPDAWYVWAGLVVSDGSILQRKVTNQDEATMERAIAMLPANARVRRKDYSAQSRHVPDWFLYWDDFWAAMPVEAAASEKMIPDWVLRSSQEKARTFLRWLYFGDGWANGKSIVYATTSRNLSTQLVVLLNRLGIRATVHVRRSTKWAEQYWVAISRSSDVLTFAQEIGIEGKGEALSAVVAEAERREAAKAQRGAHFRKSTETGSYWRERNDRARLKASKVRSVEPAGKRRVYDLSVEGEHRFLVGLNLVSNCWLDEEPPMDVYNEVLIRTATTGGIILLTFTPLSGLSEVVLSFLPSDQRPAEAA